jgi:hypothetical protein
MQGILKKIQASRQDPQLHIHPCWLNYNKNPKIGAFTQSDSCNGRSLDELKKIFKLSIEIFERWAGQKPDAIRTGSLLVERTFYKVMSELNIHLASNVGLGIFKPTEAELQLHSGRTKIDQVMEVPVFTYQDNGDNSIKTMQITSCSFPEMKAVLWAARARRIENIVIITHPFEYIKKADDQYSKITPNRVNQNRIKKLCQFINEHDQDFTSTSFGQQSKTWSKIEQENINDLRIPFYHRIIRKGHNFINDRVWNY